jgi:hypothetical protein
VEVHGEVAYGLGRPRRWWGYAVAPRMRTRCRRILKTDAMKGAGPPLLVTYSP